MKFLVALIFFFSPWLIDADNKKLASTYINNYKDIAVEEMHRTGIPASIKLAQGLLESDWGRSDLAVTANNHFGIKCGGKWNGNTFYKEDDDKDHSGKLIKSCFRSFSSPLESYMAHSDFLTDPNKEYRYGFLFEYESTDYIAWAKGLKKSGYATDPNYPKKLIKIIERYDLSRFDKNTSEEHKTYAVTKTRKKSSVKSRSSNNKKVDNKHDEAISKTYRSRSIKRSGTSMPAKHVSRLKYDIESINRCRMVLAKGGETLHELSKSIGLSVEEILQFNEIYDHKDEVLTNGEIVYIEKKKRSYRGDYEYHKVKEGETMESIAQLYGMRLKSLYSKNRMPKNSSTFPGAKLSIRKTVSLNERPKFILMNSSKRHKLLFEDDDTVK